MRVADALTPDTIAAAIIAVMRGPDGTGTPDPSLAASVAGRIRPMLLASFHHGSPADLTGHPTFRRLLSDHIPAAALEDQQRSSILRGLSGNVHSADYAMAMTSAERIALPNQTGRLALALAEGRGSSIHGGDAGSSQARAHALAGYYTSNNLPPEVRAHVDGPRASAAQVASAANYVTTIGVDPGKWAGHFVGASDTVKQAIQAHVKEGKKLDEAHITNAKDARAVIAAVQAGKIRIEDAPPSIRQIMEDMKKKGIDPTKADAKAIEGYFKQNPKALEAAKAANMQAMNNVANLSNAQISDSKRRELDAINKINGVEPADIQAQSASKSQPGTAETNKDAGSSGDKGDPAKPANATAARAKTTVSADF